MNETTRLVMIVGFTLLGIVFLGPRVAKEVNEREPSYSGDFARLLTLIGSMAFGGLVPCFLTGLILAAGYISVPIVLGLFATTLVCMLIYAVAEMPAAKQHEIQMKAKDDEGWTAEKARTSGL